MILKVFAVRDLGAQMYLRPIFDVSVGSAMRTFGDACNDPQTPFYRHPQDFLFFEIGEWDDATCEFTMLSSPHKLAMATDYKKAPEPIARPVQAVGGDK